MELDDLTAMNAIVSINREIHLYHGRANAIRPYNNGIISSRNPIILKIRDSKPGVRGISCRQGPNNL